MKKPLLTGLTPILDVKNLKASLAYYQEKLGFDCNWAWSDDESFASPADPTFACVCRGEVSLFLSQLCESETSTGQWMCWYVDDEGALQALHQAYLTAAVEVVEPPTKKPWGMCEMLVKDLDGNHFRIGYQAEASG